ncbi:MAG: glycosyltransferase [Bacteroidota bacterium]
MLTLSAFQAKYQKMPVEIYPNQTTSKKPIVTVCVFAYNHENYIAQCLDGVLMQQTDFDFVIYVGEDESTDSTRAICKEYADRYPEKIQLFLHDKRNKTIFNGRPCGKFNFMYLMLSVKTPYIALCDGDDYWTDPTKLQKQINFLQQNSDYSLCFHDAHIQYDATISEERSSDHMPFAANKSITKRDLFHVNYIPTISTVSRYYPEALEEYIMNLAFADWPMHLYSLSCGKGYYIHESMAVYRKHQSSLWATQSRIYILDQVLNAMSSIDQHFATSWKDKLALQKGFSEHFFKLILFEREASGRRAALSRFKKGLQQTHFFLLSHLFLFGAKRLRHRVRMLF